MEINGHSIRIKNINIDEIIDIDEIIETISHELLDCNEGEIITLDGKRLLWEKEVTKIIRLKWWSGDSETFEDFEVSANATKEQIEYCIKVALRCGENECETFKVIMQKKGYFCEHHRPVVEVYDFNSEEV